MSSPAMFLLDTTNPRFYTCCNRIHIKMALLLVIMILSLLEMIDTFLYVFNDNYTLDTLWQALYEVFEYVVIFCMILSFIKERSIFLIPYIGQMILCTVLLALVMFQWIFTFFFPYSDLANQFVVDKSLGRLERMAVFLVLTVISIITFLMGYWFLQVGFTAYLYFEERTAKNKTDASMAPEVTLQGSNGRLTLVNPQAAGSNQYVNDQRKSENGQVEIPSNGNQPSKSPKVGGNFTNPNFSLSDDDDDEVFHSRNPSNNPPIA